MKLQVGQRVKLLREMLGEKNGSTGFVVDTYEDLGPNGSMIIFERGNWDGFSETEQVYLSIGVVDERYEDYKFENVTKLWKDYRNGYWDFSG